MFVICFFNRETPFHLTRYRRQILSTDGPQHINAISMFYIYQTDEELTKKSLLNGYKAKVSFNLIFLLLKTSIVYHTKLRERIEISSSYRIFSFISSCLAERDRQI